MTKLKTKLKTIGAAALLAPLLALVAPTPAEAATPFRVVMIGDSIGSVVFPHVNAAPASHWDAEPARSPYDTGSLDRATAVQAIAVLALTVPNSTAQAPTYIVVQEGGTGTKDGRYIPNAEWDSFLNDTLRLTAGKCLVFVYPAYGRTVNGVPSDHGYLVAYARTVAAQQKFAANSHRCIRTINWFAAVANNPGYVQTDGLHPTVAGRNWLAAQIKAVVG